jgi:parallel beta-helix repeat protein
MGRKVIAIWLCLTMMLGFIVIVIEIVPEVTAYTSHDPFRINNNPEFASMAGLEGWAGNGSFENPYIIEGYDINGNGYGYCIYIGNTTVYFVIRDSYLHDANGVWDLPYFPDVGIVLYNVQNGTIYNNTLTKTLTKNAHGIKLDHSSNNNIINNDVSWSAYHGIYLEYSSNNTISYNNPSLNKYSGIFISYSPNNTITNNTASSNDEGGITLLSSDNTTITGNTLTNSFYGIWAGESKNNKIYHNNIISNINQAGDSGDPGNSSNQWDNGYPSGGNYWSDYGGVDNFQGPNQDLPGSDGIGDTNYSAEPDSIDHYPLMEPSPRNFFYLYPGWNLISIPRPQDDTSLTTVLQSIQGEYDAVQWYNSSDQQDPWKHYQITKPGNLNDLNNLDHLMGIWIHITNSNGIYFRYNGTQPTQNQSITLHPGWNMVGDPSLTNYNRTTGLNNLTFDTHVDAIWTYDAATQKYKQLTETDHFEIGKGYYIHAKEECTWVVPL